MTTGTVSQRNMDIRDHCPECGGVRIITDYDKGERVCSNCGCVLEDNIIDFRPEPTYEGKDRVHIGAPSNNLIHDKGLSTDISSPFRDANGKMLNCKARSKFLKLRKIHQYNRISNALDKGLVVALEDIRKLSSTMSLPDNVSQYAAIIYRKAMRKNMIRGRSIHLIATACIYISCRKNGIPRTLKEVSGAANVSTKDLGRVYRYVYRSLRIEVESMRPKDLVPRFSTELEISPSTESKAMEIIDMYENAGMNSGKGPSGIAAAAIYTATMICNELRTQRAVSKASRVTEVTIRNRTKEMMSILGM